MAAEVNMNMSFPALLQMRMRRVITIRRGADIHIETRQGEQHMTDDIPNQDIAYAMVRNAGKKSHDGRKRLITAGVFDGHGEQGHVASKLASNRMELAIDGLLSDESSSQSMTEVLKAAFKETAAIVDSAACGVGSGTTASVVIVRGDELCIGWVGDSVVIVVTDGANHRTPTIRFASPMHRTTDQDEAARIIKAGGRVQDGYVVDAGSKNGIAVTRTIGDVDMHQYGCTPEPQISRMRLQKHDAAIIIASDGLWDTNGITAEIVLSIAADKRGRTARRICQQLMVAVEEGDGPNDDCTIVCITLR